VKMLDLVDGKRTVQELVDASGLGDFEAMRGLASLVGAGAITSIGPVPAPPPIETPSVRVAPGLPARVSVAPPPWIARAAWGVAAVWLLVGLVLFRVEPLGLFPLSASRAASLDRVRALQAQADLVELAGDADWYMATAGEYPASLEALGSVARPLQDPWGHPYQIRRTGSGVSLISGGPDGRIGTPDDIMVGDR